MKSRSYRCAIQTVAPSAAMAEQSLDRFHSAGRSSRFSNTPLGAKHFAA